MANRLMISHSVAEVLPHVCYPICKQVVRCIVDRLGYHDEMKDCIDIKTDFHDWTKTTDVNEAAMVRGGSRVRVKLNPNVNPSTIKWEASGTTRDLANGNTLVQNQNGSQGAQRYPWKHGHHISNRMFSIFRDDEIAVDMSDRMTGSAMTMEVSMEFEDENLASECLSRLFQCFTNGEMINYVDLLYDVPIPEQFEKLLMYLYDLKCTTQSNPQGNKDENGHFMSYDELQYKAESVLSYIKSLRDSLGTLDKPLKAMQDHGAAKAAAANAAVKSKLFLNNRTTGI